MWKIARIQRPKFLFFFVQIAVLIVNMTSFGTRKINGGSEIKVQKTGVVMFVIDWILARYLRKTYCVWKCKKKYREFDHRGTFQNAWIYIFYRWTFSLLNFSCICSFAFSTTWKWSQGDRNVVYVFVLYKFRIDSIRMG